MENINNLIKHNGLKKVDAIVMKKRLLGMVDHYVLYMGTENNIPIFIANYSGGVKHVPLKDIVFFLNTLEPTRILKFNGTEYERTQAIIRAWSRVGERSYDYIANNCEHFVNWVHSGKSYSTQVRDLGSGLFIAGASTAAAGLLTKDKNITYVGIGALLLGALFNYLGGEEE